jgi:hypothetical protein
MHDYLHVSFDNAYHTWNSFIEHIRNTHSNKYKITRSKLSVYDEVFSGYQAVNHLTRLIARENFIILSRRESNKSH